MMTLLNTLVSQAKREECSVANTQLDSTPERIQSQMKTDFGSHLQVVELFASLTAYPGPNRKVPKLDFNT